MANEVVVREIVETYDDLSPKLKERIISIATKRTSELSLNSFDTIYGYIGYLIDRFRGPYKRVLSLDSPIMPDSDLTFKDIIGVEDNYFEGAEGLSANAAFSILQGHTDRQYAYLLHHLSADDTFTLDISPEAIVSNAPQIQARLEELLHKYGRNGRLVIPARPIVTVNFNPLQIRFGPRYYHGNPLAFFMEHNETYEGMGRTQLKLFDSGLYDALGRHDQLDKAIPEVRPSPVKPKLTLQQQTEAINAFVTNGGNALKASQHSPFSHPTILQYARRAGKEIRVPGRHDYSSSHNGTQKRQYRGYESPLAYFRAHPEKYGGLSRRRIRSVDSGLYYSLKGWGQLDDAVDRGLAVSENKLLPGQIADIVNAYPTHNGNATETARDLGYAFSTVLRYWREAELEVSRPGRRRNNTNSK